MTTPATPAGRTERATNGFLVLIVLAVGLMAAAASFRHVHDWTMHNSPDRTADWFGWANAVITELIPTAALIIISRRRKSRAPIGYPMFLLIATVGLSLTAQLAVARPTVFGWMVSALPALAFFALSKLVFTATKVPAPAPTPAPATVAPDAARLDQLAARLHHLETRPTETPVPALTPATLAPAPSSDTAPAKGRPAAKKTPAKKTTSSGTRSGAARKSTAAKAATPALAAEPGTDVDTLPFPMTADLTAQLLPGARIVADAHHSAHGTPITPQLLADRMRIAPTIAEGILDALAAIDRPATTDPHNGAPIGSTTIGAHQ